MYSAQPKQPFSSYGMHPPLSSLVAALPQLDVLWHYDCVVSPHSYAGIGANLPKPAPSPHSHVAKLLQAGDLPTACSSPCAPSRDHSHVDHANDHNQDHRKQALVQRVFNTFDENGDGAVSIHEISRMFEKLGIEYSMESLLASLVTKSEGYVDEKEFLSLYESIGCSDASASSSNLQADVDQDLLAAFHVFDKDGNGFISPAELQSVLCSLGFPQGRQLEACVDMIARVDENGDGLVDFFEFKKLFHYGNPFTLISSY